MYERYLIYTFCDEESDQEDLSNLQQNDPTEESSLNLIDRYISLNEKSLIIQKLLKIYFWLGLVSTISMSQMYFKQGYPHLAEVV
jgi:hypothetical protein